MNKLVVVVGVHEDVALEHEIGRVTCKQYASMDQAHPPMSI